MSTPGWGFDEPKPPDNPEKIIYHGPYRGGKGIPEEIRRVFGTPPPEGFKKPVPPPPLPPNSYHKKPKYWQMRYTSHQQIPNRVAGVICVGMIGICYLLDKFSGVPDRWNKRLGFQMTPQEKEDYDKKNTFYYEMMTYGTPPDMYAINETGDKYINTRRADKKVRWDIREIDKDMVGIKDLQNPMDDPL